MLRPLLLALLLAPAFASGQAVEPAPQAGEPQSAPAETATTDAAAADPGAAPPAEAPTEAPADAAAAETAASPVPPPDAPVPTAAAAPPPEPAGPSPEQQRFDQFRRDLVSLLALRAEPDLLVAAAELAYPDGEAKDRSAGLKSPALIKRAQKFGPDQALVWWVSTFLCSDKPSPCRAEAVAALQKVAPDNAAVWLPALHAAKDPGQARALLASMAQAPRFDDFWSAGVLAVYRAAQTLPVPAEVLGHGLNAVAARINLATGVGGGFLPNYSRLLEMCRSGEGADEALVSDCLAVARLLENGSSFTTQAAGFAIEDALLPAGTARDVLRVRQRASQWQKQQFLELSARFTRDEALAASYVELLGKQQAGTPVVVEFLRSQKVSTEPPPGWQPAHGEAPATPPLDLGPGH